MKTKPRWMKSVIAASRKMAENPLPVGRKSAENVNASVRA